MPYSVVSNFTFLPALAEVYASKAYEESIELLAQSLGVVKTQGVEDFAGNLADGSEFLNMPYFDTIASLVSRRDLESTSAPTDLDLTGLNEIGVLLRRKAGPVKFTEDLFVRGISVRNAEADIGRQIGQKAAQEIREQLIRVTIAAVESLDTPTANAHISDVYAASGTKVKLTFSTLNVARNLLADRQLSLSTVVMHSDAFSDLVADGIANYKIENVGGAIIVTGHPAALGMRIVVVDDAQLKVTSGLDYKVYRTLLYGPNALRLIYHRNVTISAERRLDFEAPYWRVLANHDYCPHLSGMGWISTTPNPTNTDLETAGNWDEKYTDHRQVLAAILRHNATAA
jgi:hypothetical protein